jgi:transposase
LNTIKSLPDDPAKLKGLIAQMKQEITSQAYQIEKLKAELYGHRKARFGSKSESSDQLALDLQDDQEIAAAADAQHAEHNAADAADAADEDAVSAKPPRAKRTHNRIPLPDHLYRQNEVLLPGEQCDDCGGSLRQIGEDVTEELASIPGRFVVRRIIRPRMTCTCCEAFSQAPLPSRPIERGRQFHYRSGPGLLAPMLVGKYCDHLPLERQSKIFARENVHLPRSTLTDWVGRSTALLEPLADHIGKLVRAGPALFADDTPVKLPRQTAQQAEAKEDADRAALELCAQ